MNLYILQDTSGSMEGAKIGALNDCMQNILITLQEYAFSGHTINLDVLSFARSAKWMYDEIKPILAFEWSELKAGGMTSLGNACSLLSQRLRSQQNGEEDLIILISDGCPTDDYQNAIIEIRKNNAFIGSRRYAIAIGEDADIPSLNEFVDDPEKVYSLTTVSELLDTIIGILSANQIPDVHVTSASASDDDDEWS